MKFEEALQQLKKSKIIREKNSGKEYNLFIADNNQVEVVTTTNIKDLVISYKRQETITWKEILSNDWEVIE